MSSLDHLLREAVLQLRDAGVTTPEVDARLLAAHALHLNSSEVQLKALTGMDLSEEQQERVTSLVADRAQRIPLQHLTGEAAFRHLELRVGPGAFIPRPETETLVDIVLEYLGAKARVQPRLIDLGTGSGAIAAALAHEIPGATVWAVELSETASAWAKLNFENLPAGSAAVELLREDLAQARRIKNKTGPLDVVVSNPPYIPADMVPQEEEVRLHDPELALYGGGTDGLVLPRAVIETAAELLETGGLLVMEHAEVQAQQLAADLDKDPRFHQVRTHQDLTGRDRATSAVLTGTALSAWENTGRE